MLLDTSFHSDKETASDLPCVPALERSTPKILGRIKRLMVAVTTLLVLVLLQSSVHASHITGGEIFYKCLGGDQYEITLKLWKDCDKPFNLPVTGIINVYYIEGGEYVPGFPASLPRLVYDTLDLGAYGNACFIPPASICVMEALYIDTVTMPFTSGGYQIAWECGNRNAIIDNIVSPSATGSSLIMNVPMSTIDYHFPKQVWFENFEDRSVGDEIDVGATAWTTTCNAGPAPPNNCGLNDGSSNDYFEVRSNGTNLEYEGRDVDNEAVWTTEAIDISSYATGVRISMELSENAYNSGGDYVRAYYKINGGAETALTNGLQSNGFNSVIATAKGLIGLTLEIVVRMDNNGGSEEGRFDDVLVSEMPIWREDFQDLTVGDEVDVGPTAWATACAAGPAPPNVCGLNDGDANDYFEVRINSGNYEYEGKDLDAEAVWASDIVAIAAYPAGVSIQMELSESGYDDAADYVNAYYKLDGGAEIALTNGLQSGDFNSVMTWDTALTGATIQIVVRMDNGGGDDEGRIDNIDIYQYIPRDTVGQTIICNSSPSFNFFPPIFICRGDSATIDQSATDPDGDSLVYSLATPYGGFYFDAACPGDGPPYVPITWSGIYSETNQIVGTLRIDSVTGLLTVVPAFSATDSDFVVCVKVQEYRNDSLLNENVKDFQFHVIQCQSDQVEAAPSSNYVCGGSLTITFVNDSIDTVDVAPVKWDFGDLATIADTSILDTATYTYPDTGTYTVRLITNPGLVCADTGFITITLTSGILCCLAGCELTVPKEDVDLSAKPDTVWTITGIGRADQCCGSTSPSRCIRFDVTVNPLTEHVSFDVQNPGPPGGAFFQINCGPTYSLGDSVCIVGMTTFCITFCKAGGDTPDYIISASRRTSSGPDITLGEGCQDTLWASGLDEATISWTSVWPGPIGTYDSYLSCTSACDSTIITAPDPKVIDSVQYEVSGTALGCAVGIKKYTTWVYFVDRDSVSITPPFPAICFGAGGVTLTSSGFGGAKPYTFVWTGPSVTPVSSTDSTSVIIAGVVGEYSVEMFDTSNCGPVHDTVVVVAFGSPVSADAGPDDTVCTSSPAVSLVGTVVAADSGRWTSITGAGAFAPSPDSLTTIYTPDAAEIVAGTASLMFETRGNRGCAADTDTIVIVITALPTTSADVDDVICAGSTYMLNGSIGGGATSLTWTTDGDGSFDDANLAAATYTPGAADIAGGSVKLAITTDDPPGPCIIETDTMTLTIDPAATVGAGGPATICEGSSYLLSGSFGGSAGTISWAGGDGLFDDNTLPAATYAPGPLDIGMGGVTLTITTDDPGGPCLSVSATMTLTINASPTVGAGGDATICAGTSHTLVGTMGGSTSSITWSSSGTGSFDDVNLLGATYTPSDGDTAAPGLITLTITSDDPDGAGPCTAVLNTMTLTINPEALVSAGGDATICAGSSHTLSGTKGGATTSTTWTSSGTGTFDDDAILGATYTPSDADTAAPGIITLTLTSNDPDAGGPCTAVLDAMTLSINPEPIVGAGGDATICAGTSHTLVGSMGGATSLITWSSSGTGSFDDVNLLGATYTPSDGDTAAPGLITLTITSDDPDGAGPCTAVLNTMTLTINPEALVSAGGDATICAGSSHTLSGTKGGATTSTTWTSSGTGTFDDDAILGATYTPSDADTAAPGIITLTLTSNDPDVGGPCTAVLDAMTLSINPEPTVGAGVDDGICAYDTYTLSGTIGGSASSITWTSSGTGSFDDINLLGATYTPSAADTALPNVTLTITTNDPDGAGPCVPGTDFMTLSFTPADKPNYSYSSATYCVTGADPTPVITGTPGGIFSGAGVVFIGGLGQIDLGATGLGVYAVQYLTPGLTGCPDSLTVAVTITIAPDASFSYASPFCQGDPNPFPSFPVGASAGKFSAIPVGMVFANDNTGEIDLTASTPGVYTVRNLIVASGGCSADSAFLVVTINVAPTVGAAGDDLICEGSTYVLSGVMGGSTSSITWSTSGDGGFDLATLLGAEYTPGVADIAAGSVTLKITSDDPAGPCVAVADSMVLSINLTATTNAGSDTSVCEGSSYTLPGVMGGTAASITWTTPGDGSFDNPALPAATYTPGAADIAAGFITLTITTNDPDGAGPCVPAFDDILITINPIATVTAGPNDTICEGSTSTLVGAFGGGASSITWTTPGDGGFNDPNLPGAIYTPGVADIAAGSVVLTITTDDPDGLGPCLAVSNTMTITINAVATSAAGSDTTICSGSSYTLSGALGGSATSITWSSPGDGLFDNNTLPGATYSPGVADIAAGFITLTITTNDPDGAGPCVASFDDMILTINLAATASAGANDTICEGSTYLLSGGIGGSAISSEWTTSGDGAFDDSSLVGATYTAGIVDITLGTVTLTITTNDPAGPCPADFDVMVLEIDPIPTVGAGSNTTICSGSGYTLAGTRGGGASSSVWVTTGDGSFDDSSLVAATYTPGAADIAAGFVRLGITTDDPAGPCPAISDSMDLTINLTATASAGANDTICAGITYTLAGAIGGSAASLTWTTSGTGVFNSNIIPGPIYTPSAADTTAGGVVLTITTNDPDGAGPCTAAVDSMALSIQSGIIVDAGPDGFACANNANVSILGSVSGATTTGGWISLGTGSFTPDTSTLAATYNASPLDTVVGSVTIILKSTNNGGCIARSDTMIITFGPGIYVIAGIDDTVCANNDTVPLGGIVSGATMTGQWSSSGSGIFSPNDSDLGAIYLPSDSDTIVGSVILTLTSTNNGLCIPVQDSISIEITSAPYVSAGPDAFACKNNPNIVLNGSVGGPTTTGNWSGFGEDGSFSPSTTDLGATYIPGSADTALGMATIVLSSTLNGNCAVETDTVILNYTDAPIVNAGADDSLCASDTVVLSGTVLGGAGTGKWTSTGTGTFAPSDSDLIATYIFSLADTSLSSIDLVLSSTNAVGCLVERDTMTVDIVPAPQVNAGLDQSVCANNDTIILSGVVFGATTTGKWTTTGPGTFSPNDSDLNATYIPGYLPTVLSLDTLILTSTNNGMCIAFSDTMLIDRTPAPSVTAGNDTIICSGDNIALSGIVIGGASSGKWTTTGTGTFAPNDSDMTATYIPSAADTTAGIIDISLESTNNGGCVAVFDTMTVTFTPKPTVAAGVDVTVCANNDSVFLAGSVTGSSTTGQWVSNGTGAFSPNDSDLSAVYVPSDSDTVVGSVRIILFATNSCPLSDTLFITITPAPQVNAGSDFSICFGDITAALSGSVLGGTSTGKWTTTGDGSFSPNDSDLNPTYVLGIGDTLPTITMILTSTNNGMCLVVVDSIIVTRSAVAIVDAGTDFSFCSNNATIPLIGTVTGGGTAGIWTTSGSGSFGDSVSLTTTYVPSPSDTAAGSVTITLTSTDACLNVADSATFTLTPAPKVNAGTDVITCANNADAVMSGNVFAGATTGVWLSLGDGSFSPTTSNLGATYSPGAADISSGSATLVLTSTFNGMCFPETDTMTVIIGPAPVVDAGLDQVVCNGDIVFLVGSVTAGSSTGFWTSTGTGTFADASVLNAVYTPSAADTLLGSVFLILSSTFNGTCVAVSDIMAVTLTTKPTVVAGNDTSVCANNIIIVLSGSVTGSTTSGRWSSSGTGTFSPNDSDLSATYLPSAADTASGSITISLVSTNACQIRDSLTITITPAPEVDAGPDQIHCSDTLSIDLVGSVSSGSTTGIWTSSGSGTFTNDTLMTTTYFPSSTDTLLGLIYITLTSTNNGKCLTVVDSMTISFVPPPIVTVGADDAVCANKSVPLNGTVSGGSTTGFWSTIGTGTFLADSTDLNGSYTFSASDTALGSLTMILESASSPGCPARRDSFLVTILPGPQVNAGNDTTVCMNNDTIFLNGSVHGAATTGKWATNGSGVFLPNDSDLTGVYVPSQADNDSGLVVLSLTSTNNTNGCFEESDNLLVTFSPTAPIVSAGPDKFVCNGNSFNINGSVSGGATTGIWTTTGAGTFAASDSDLIAIYMPGPTDTSTAFIVVLTSTNNGTCLAEMDTVNVVYTAQPLVSAGPDDTVCTNNDTVFLAGLVSGTSTTGYWLSTGSGSFAPDSTALAGTYSPSAADAIAGTISLILQSTNACLVTDTLVLEIIPAPFVTTGGPYILCVGDTAASLSGVVSGITTTGIWTTPGIGNFSPNDSDLSATYFLDASEQAVGDSTMLVLTSTNNGQCLEEYDTSYIVITTIPTVSAGPDDTECANVDYQLAGVVTGGAGTGVWSTMGSGSFIPDSTALTGNYVFSAADTTIKLVTLVLTTTDACVTLTDSMDLTVTPAPMVSVSINQSVCSNNDSITLLSNIVVATGGIWSTDGAGTFFPDSIASIGADSIIYILGQQEIDSGNVVLTLISTGNGNCNPESGVLNITIIAAPIVDAGQNQSVCFDDFNVVLNGSVTGSTITGAWSTSGSGFFAPNDSTVNAVYVPSLLDTAAGSATLSLTSTNNGTCNIVSDSMIVTWSERPVVQVSGDTSVCVGTTVIPISGTVTGSPGTGLWTSSGTGTFSPSDTSLSPTYNPSSADDSTGSVVLTLMATNGCAPSLDSLTIYINPNPVAAFIATTFCDSLDVPIVDQSLISSGAITSWNWGFGDGFTDSVQFPAHTYTGTGNYSVQLTVTSDSGCTSTANQAISLNAISSSFSVVPGCAGQIVPFIDSSIVSNDVIVSWTWDFGDGTSSSSQNASHTYLDSGQFNVGLTIQTQSGCVLSSNQTVFINPNPIAGFTVSNLKPVQFDMVGFFDQSKGASIWAWDFGNGQTSQLQNPSHSYQDYGTFIVTQYVQTDSGCSDTITMSIEVIGEFSPDVPTAFSPNGNGENDIFYARGGPFTEMLLKVYNEWGELIFTSTEPGIGGGWDGTKDGIAQPVGVYAYIIKSTLDSGEEFNRHGDITLIR